MKRVIFIVGLTFLVLLLLAASRQIPQDTQIVSESIPLPSKTPVQTTAYKNPFDQVSQDSGILYPIAELGNCSDASECHTYCSVPKNTPACWSYGTYVLQKQVLGVSTTINNQHASTSCDDDPTCKAYCQAHPGECPGFATTAGLGDFATVYLGPNGCRTFEECEMYCQAHPSQCPGSPSSNISQTATPSVIPTTYQQPIYETPSTIEPTPEYQTPQE